MRITRKNLENLCGVVNRRLNRPETAWTKTTDKLTANVGHIHVTGWAPGDGWTRYQVCEVVSDGGGITTISHVGTSHEIFYYLRGVLDALDQRYSEKPKQAKQAKAVQS